MIISCKICHFVNKTRSEYDFTKEECQKVFSNFPLECIVKKLSIVSFFFSFSVAVYVDILAKYLPRRCRKTWEKLILSTIYLICFFPTNFNNSRRFCGHCLWAKGPLINRLCIVKTCRKTTSSSDILTRTVVLRYFITRVKNSSEFIPI